MDDWLIARHQSLVNLFQHKPIWWIEQCAYALLLGACGRFFFRTQADGFSAWGVFFLLMDLFVAAYCWVAGRSEVFKERVFGYHQGFIRSFFTFTSIFYIGIDVVLLYLGGTPTPLSLITDLCSVLLTSCFFFGACEPPPPPKPRTKMAFNGGDA